MSKLKEYLSDHARVAMDDDGVIQAIKPDSHCNFKTLSETVQAYVEDQIEYFINKNHISKRAWNKRGIIVKEASDIELLVYKLVYKTKFRNCSEEIKIGFEIATRI